MVIRKEGENALNRLKTFLFLVLNRMSDDILSQNRKQGVSNRGKTALFPLQASCQL